MFPLLFPLPAGQFIAYFKTFKRERIQHQTGLFSTFCFIAHNCWKGLLIWLGGSVAGWAVFPHSWAVFFPCVAGFFLLLRVAVFGLVLSKCMRFFGKFFRQIFLSKSVVFVNSAEVVRFVFT